MGLAPLTVTFSSEGTSDADGDALEYAWDFDADGTVDSTERNPVHTYSTNGVFQPTLKVTDSTGVVMRDNVADDNWGHGIWYDSFSHDATVIHNVTRRNASAGWG